MQVSPHVRNDQAGVPFRIEVASDATSIRSAVGIASANHRVAAGLASAGSDAIFIMDNEKESNLRT